MSHENSFTVSRFENRNGVTSWRLAGWLQGVRIRKNFKSREEAAVEKGALEIKALQATSGLRSIATALTEDQVREAEAAFRRLDGKPCSLIQYLDIALVNFRGDEPGVRLADAVEKYLALKTKNEARTLLSFRQLRSIRHELTTSRRDSRRQYFENSLRRVSWSISNAAESRSRPTTTAGASCRRSSSSRLDKIGSR